MKRTIYILTLILLPLQMHGQFLLRDQLVTGSNTVSDGLFVRNDLVLAWEKDIFSLSGGLELSSGNVNPMLVSGWNLTANVSVLQQAFPIDLTAFFLRNPYSSLSRETNFGLGASYKRPHVRLQLGIGTRIWSLVPDKTDPTGLPDDPDYTIIEYRNFLYSFSYFLNEPEAKWNLELRLSDFDEFLVQQETNPMVALAFMLELKPGLHFLASGSYQGSGMLNLQADYYGYYFKTGIQWAL